MTSHLAGKHVNPLATGFQFGNDPVTVYGGVRAKIQKSSVAQKTFHHCRIGIGFCGLLHSLVQLHDGYGAYAQLALAGFELFSRIAAARHLVAYADTGVEHVFEHQNPSRSRTGGCSHSTMKSAVTPSRQTTRPKHAQQE